MLTQELRIISILVLEDDDKDDSFDLGTNVIRAYEESGGGAIFFLFESPSLHTKTVK